MIENRWQLKAGDRVRILPWDVYKGDHWHIGSDTWEKWSAHVQVVNTVGLQTLTVLNGPLNWPLDAVVKVDSLWDSYLTKRDCFNVVGEPYPFPDCPQPPSDSIGKTLYKPSPKGVAMSALKTVSNFLAKNLPGHMKPQFQAAYAELHYQTQEPTLTSNGRTALMNFLAFEHPEVSKAFGAFAQKQVDAVEKEEKKK